MKTCCLFLLSFFLLNFTLAQNQAAHFTGFSQYYRCGNINVSGTQLTVEALVKIDGTGPFVTGQSAHDIVSKHNGAGDANYILRPDHCEISTTTGHYISNLSGFTTFIKDSFYHVALTYDGSFLKFYVNGCLYSQTAATGNLINNSYITTIGQLASNPTGVSVEQLYGYADEVRIWSVVRTETEIRDNMRDLLNAASYTGLLAYYKFEGNSINVQGNPAFNAIPFGSPMIETQNGFDRIKTFNARYTIQNPLCGNTGSITVLAEGGKSPYRYSINGGPYQASNTFNSLGAGSYLVSVRSDGISCIKDTTIILTQNCSINSCDNWLRLPTQPSYVRVGDLDIPGNQLTIEASFIRTSSWTGGDVFQGDLVSKHEAANDCNYLLRPGSAEITTTNGYFKTPTICQIQLNKTYHAAMVYDGTTLKFYRNGFLMSQIPASGNLIQNNWQTQIGLYFNQITQENFIGYINEVRIWNIPRSQSQIRAYMNQSLPSPQTTPGLLAYYTFDNLLNKQGNSAWNGTLGGSASINQSNPNCTFLADSCGIQIAPCGGLPKIDFDFHQSMCSPNTVQFSTVLSAAQSYQWNFGNSQTNNSSLTPTVTYSSFGSYPVKLVVQYPSGCTDSVEKMITVNSIFDNTLIQNNDTTICLGDSVRLNTNNALNFCWRASLGLSPVSLNQYVKPTSATTYFLASQVMGNNLIANGDFNSGNMGFTSQYAYNSSSGFSDGVYNVGSNITAWHSGMSNCNDHTSGNANMMMVNGSTQLNVKVWSQTVPVQPNTNYAFYTWLQTITTVNPAQLQFSINGVPVGNVFSASSQSCIWQQFNATWNSGNNTSATISILNMNQVFSGNDFALDDIFFGEVTTKTDSFTVSVKGLCDSVKITGTDKICSRTDTLTYSIYKSPNCTQQFSLQVDPAFADVILQTATTVKLVFKQNGSTSIKVSYANDCKTVVDSLAVNVRFSPDAINFGPDITTCRDTLLTLNAGNGFTSYAWQNASTDSTFIVNAPGTYYVTTQNLCGRQLTDTLRVIRPVAIPFAVQPPSATVCQGDSVQFMATGGTVYSWSPAANFNNSTSASPKAVVNNTQNFSVLISDPLCLRDTTIIIPVTATSGASISLSKSNDVSCGNDSAVLVASGGVSYTWSPNLFIARNYGDRITVKPTQNTTYTVVGVDASGCAGKDSVTVAFVKQGEQKLFTPTAFTPNGDGLNDVFRPVFIGPALKYEFKIYNRWGQLVFHSKTPGQGWDGTYRGVLQRSDVFVYYITAEGGCNGKFEQKGTIALIK